MNTVFTERSDRVVSGKAIEILLVEDNPEDAALTIETLGKVASAITLRWWKTESRPWISCGARSPIPPQYGRT